MSCTVLSKTNREESILYKQLLTLASNDELLANRYYDSFDNENFIKDFGDYKSDFFNENKTINSDRVDENGEPKLYKDEDYNRYYYLNNNYEKIYFPNKSLLNILTSNSLTNIKKTLGAQYILNNFNLAGEFDNLDFEQTSSTNLTNFILNKLNEKKSYFDSLETRASKIKSKRIELLLSHLDELKDEVIDYFKTLKINYIEDANNLEDNITKEEDVREQSFNVSSFERSSKENVNSDIKIILSLIPNYNENSFDEIFNEPSFYSFNEVYGSLLKLLANTTSLDNIMLYDEMINKLEKEKEFQPFIKNLLILLQNVSDETKSKFTNAFNLAKNDMYTIDVVKEVTSFGKTKSYEHKVFSVTELNSKAGRIQNEWSLNFNKLFLNKNKLNKEKFKEVSDKIDNFYKEYNKTISKSDLTVSEFLNQLNPLLNILSDLGVLTTEEGLNYFLRSDIEDPNNIEAIKLQTQYLLNKLNYFKKAVNENKIDFSQTEAIKYENIFKQLAEAESIYFTEGSESSIFTYSKSGSKTKWTFSKPSYIKNKVEKFKKYPELIKKELESTVFNSNSKLLNYLSGKDLNNLSENELKSIILERLKQFDVGIFNNFQQTDEKGFDSVDNKDITTNDEINMYINSLLSFINDKDPIIRSTTPADKSTQMLLKLPKQIFVRSNFNVDDRTISDSAIDILYEYFIDEYKRMHKVASEIELSKNKDSEINLYSHYHLGAKNGLKSQLFNSLSVQFNKKGEIESIPSLEDSEGNPILLYDSITGYPVLEGFNYNVEESIKEHIKKQIISEIFDTTKEFLEIGVFEDIKRSSTENNSIDSNIFNKYKDLNQNKLYNIKYQIAADVYINGIISQVEYSKVFTGDYAYYKNMIDFKKRVPATYTDGQYLNTKEEFFNTAVIKSVEGVSPFKNEFEELVRNNVITQETADYYINKDINIADAQAWITPERWKFIQNGLGKWSKKYDIIFDKMSGKNKEPYTEKELKILMQPLKGVYFETLNGVPTFLKYSQAVLVPSLIKGTSLEKMYNKMTKEKDYKNQIHEVITFDGVKVGALNPTQIHKDEDATELKDDFELNKQVLLNSGWKLQQDLPTKTVKMTDVGSQIQKNVYQGLANNLESIFHYKGEEKTGDEMISIINKIVGDLSNKGLEQFYKELGINDNGKIENKELFFNSLAEQLISQDGNKNIIQALKTGVNPIGTPQAYEKIMNVFASIALDRIVKIKTNGGSFIQMSDFGINKNEAESKGIIWTPWSKNKVNSYEILKDSQGNIIKSSNGKPLIKPAGILISGSFIAKYIPNYKKYNSKELFGILNPETNEYEDGMIDYKILTNLIGYRIPNQGLSSNDTFNIVGILPEEMGDTIIAYTGITTKTGSDYDIDKMYMMIPSYDFKDEKLVYKNSLENDLIEAYKSVFSNSDVLNDLLTPIDFEYVKNDTVTFNPIEKETDTSHFNAIKDIKTKSEYKAGKAGVGMEANALVDHVRGSMSSLKFKNYNIGVGHIVNGETIFDKEYSQELSESDLNLYLKKYNEISKEKLDKKELESLKKIKISNSLSAVLNAFVDIAKDPYITRGNWNTTTTNVGNMLLRAGVHPFHVNAFLRHPILKEYINFQNNKESKIINDTGNIENKFILEQLRKTLDFQENIKFKDGRTFSISELHKFIYKNNLERNFNNLKSETLLNKFRNIQYYNYEGKLEKLFSKEQFELNKDDINKVINTIITKQISFLTSSKVEENYFPSFKELLTNDTSEFGRKVLTVFNKLKEDSKKVKKNVDASTQDVRGFGSNSISLITRYNKINDMLKADNSGDLVGFNTKMIYNNELTLLGHYTNNVIKNMMKVVSNNPELFFTIDKNIINNFDQISLDIKNTKLLDEDFGEDIEKKFISYIFSGFPGVKSTTEEFNHLTSKDFINDFKIFKESKINRYKILEELDITKGKKLEFINMSNRKKDSDTQFELTKSWLDMLNNDREMAVNLIKYSFITSGFNMNKGQFYTLIPYQYFIENNINSYLKNLQIPNLDINFIEQFYENNYDNNTYVPKFFDNDILKTPGMVKPFGFILDIDYKEAKRYIKQINKDDEGNEILSLYKSIGYNSDMKPIYIRVIPKGYKDQYGNKFYQYSFDSKIEQNFEGVSKEFKNNLIKYYENLSKLKVYDFNMNKIEDKTELPEQEELTEDVILDSNNSKEFILNDKGFEEIKIKWEESGYTKEDWDLMLPEDREHIIKNCL